jgi:hypothetical protein
MFTHFFEYSQIKHTESKALPYDITTYKFKTRQRVYWVNVEKYDLDIYIVKFHIAAHERSKKRYNLTINDQDNCTGRILRTVLEIIKNQVLTPNPHASIGFIGAEKYDKNRPEKNEDKDNTQRFRIYQTLTNNVVGLGQFEHHYDNKTSAYLLVNRKNKNIPAIVKSAKKMFRELYQDLDGI